MGIKHIIKTPEQLLEAGFIDKSIMREIAIVADRFAIAITPQMQELIVENNDAIAAQFIPTVKEMLWDSSELEDPIADNSYSPQPGIVHRYPDRVLLKPIHICAVYCRFCFRREMIGPGSEAALNNDALEAALDYIASRKEIWEVIITGGDPMIMPAKKIANIMQRLNQIDHLAVIRFHSRIPVVRPDLIDDKMLAALKSNKAVYIVLHVNHSQELSAMARVACAKLIDNGFPMLSQTVLLNKVNADVATLTNLFRSLTAMRIKPYYLHHGDLARGTGHFRTSIATGQEIMQALRGNVSGLCQPLYVLDIPGGHGKVPINNSYIENCGDKYQVTDYQGNKHDYQDRLAIDTL